MHPPSVSSRPQASPRTQRTCSSRTAMFAKPIVTRSSPLFMSSPKDSLQTSMQSHVDLRLKTAAVLRPSLTNFFSVYGLQCEAIWTWPRELSSSTSKPTLPLPSTSNSKPVLLHLCTVYPYYSDAPHLRTPSCQYKDIPVWSVTVGRLED